MCGDGGGHPSAVRLSEPPEPLEQSGVTIELLPGTRVMRMTRNEQPFENVNAMIGVLDEYLAQTRLVDRSQYRLLIDTRRIPMRADAGFERAFRHFREHSTTGFARVAILVETAEGLRQASGHAREMGDHVRAFDVEDAAMSWVLDASGRVEAG